MIQSNLSGFPSSGYRSLNGRFWQFGLNEKSEVRDLVGAAGGGLEPAAGKHGAGGGRPPASPKAGAFPECARGPHEEFLGSPAGFPSDARLF